MKKSISLFIAIAMGLTFGLTSCNPDDPDDPTNPKNEGEEEEVFVSKTPQNSNVLVEELTGIGCQFCPDGHKLCDSLTNHYDGKFYSINIHTGVYATNRTPDYTTVEGDSIRTAFGVNGYPNGYINRFIWNVQDQSGQSKRTIAMGRGYFPVCAERIMTSSPAYANVAAKASINKSTRELTVKVQVYFTAEGDTTAIHVALVQNGLESTQSGASQWYPEHYNAETGMYTHYHMLRKQLHNFQGDIIGTGKADQLVTKTYTYTIPETLGNGNIEAVLENMEVFVYITESHVINANGIHYPYPIVNVCKSSMKLNSAGMTVLN